MGIAIPITYLKISFSFLWQYSTYEKTLIYTANLTSNFVAFGDTGGVPTKKLIEIKALYHFCDMSIKVFCDIAKKYFRILLPLKYQNQSTAQKQW